MLKTLMREPYWLWVLLSLPAFAFAVNGATQDGPEVIEELLHETGEFSARFMIIAMLASPLVLLLKGWRFPNWLRKNRRYFGVAAFGYALFHTVVYLMDRGGAAGVIADLPKLYIWTGWVAFVVFVPLAITSHDYFVRVMGRRWKTLQRATYVAAIFTLIHWAALHDWGGLAPALVHFVPLAALEAYRIWYWTLRKRPVPTL